MSNSIQRKETYSWADIYIKKLNTKRQEKFQRTLQREANHSLRRDTLRRNRKESDIPEYRDKKAHDDENTASPPIDFDETIIGSYLPQTEIYSHDTIILSGDFGNLRRVLCGLYIHADYRLVTIHLI